MKKIFSFLLSLFMLANVIVQTNVSVFAATPAINAQQVEIYNLYDYARDYISIPDGYNQSFQLQVKGAANVEYSVESGSSAKVSSKGLIEPEKKKVTVITPDGTYNRYDYTFGKSTIKVVADSKVFYVTVDVINYDEIYAANVIKKYAQENFTNHMTDNEILEKIAQFPASYNYDAACPRLEAMLVTGGGDCWASTSAIVSLCNELGITAWGRNANRDLGAGSGHKNAIVELNGKYYEIEAGYNQKAPRKYKITERDTLLDIHYYSAGAYVYQYSGNPDVKVDLVIPDEIFGDEIIGIEANAFKGYTNITSVSLANTIKTIGENAFANCSLKNVYYNGTLSQWCNIKFANASSNPNCYADGFYINNRFVNKVTMPKGMTQVPDFCFAGCSGIETVELDAKTTSIGNSAFSGCKSLKNINLPDTIESIGPNAFAMCQSLEKVNLTDNLKDLGAYAFTSSGLKNVSVPNSITQINEGVFRNCVKLESVSLPGSLTNIGERVFTFCDCLGDVYYDGYKKDWNKIEISVFNDVLKNARIHCLDTSDCDLYGHSWNNGTITKPASCTVQGIKTYTCTVCGESKTNVLAKTAHTYKAYVTAATQSSDGSIVDKCSVCGAIGTTQTIPKVSTVELQKTTIGYDWYYTGKQITPYITVIDSAGNKLTRGTDYSLTYDSGRVNIGTYAIKVTFKGNYSGTKTFTFKIVKKPVTGKWIKSGNRWWYKHSDGSYTKNAWEKINGKWYHFDKSGWMQNGWLKVSNKWYYLSSSGAMVTGWQKVSNKWYYMNSSGAMVTGWQKVSNKWYYMNSSGAMVTGWQKIGGAWYCFNSSGAMYSNQWVGNYYVDANGRRVKSR